MTLTAFILHYGISTMHNKKGLFGQELLNLAAEGLTFMGKILLSGGFLFLPVVVQVL